MMNLNNFFVPFVKSDDVIPNDWIDIDCVNKGSLVINGEKTYKIEALKQRTLPWYAKPRLIAIVLSILTFGVVPCFYKPVRDLVTGRQVIRIVSQLDPMPSDSKISRAASTSLNPIISTPSPSINSKEVVASSKVSPVNQEDLNFVKSKIHQFMFAIATDLVREPNKSLGISSFSIIQVVELYVRNFGTEKEKAAFLKALGCEKLSIDLVKTGLEEIKKDLAKELEGYENTKMSNVNVIGTIDGCIKDPRLLREENQGVPCLVASSPEDVKNLINNYVTEATKGSVSSPLTQPSSCAIVNAFTFEFLWKNAFKPQQTKLRPFHLEGNTMEVYTMQMEYKLGLESSFEVDRGLQFVVTDGVRYLKKPQFIMLSLPYVSKASPCPEDENEIASFGGDAKKGLSRSQYPLRQIIILPNEDVSLQSVIQDMNHESFCKLANELRSRELTQDEYDMQIEFPLLKIESRPDLQAALKKFGLPDNPDLSPDFSHVFKMEQDEVGTTVRAVTVADLKGGGQSTHVLINRPFQFFVMHDDTILAQGVVNSDSVLVKTRKNKS